MTDQTRPRSLPPPEPERDIYTLTRGSYLNQGFVTDENENWTEIQLQPSTNSTLQVPGQVSRQQSRRERPKSEGNQSHHRVKKYLKDQINERINKSSSATAAKENPRKDTWTAVITSVMTNVLFILSLLLTVVLPFVLFIIGCINYKSCPAIPSLPLLLIVIGLLVTSANVVNAIDSLTSEEPFGMNNNLKKVIVSSLNIVFNSFVIVSLIMLTIWIAFHDKPAFKRQEHTSINDVKQVATSTSIPSELVLNNTNETATSVQTTTESSPMIEASRTIQENYCHPLVYSTCLYIVYTVSFIFILTLIMSIIKYAIKERMVKKAVEDESDDEQEEEEQVVGCTQQ